MYKLEVKRLLERYRGCIPSVVIMANDGTQFYCANLHSIRKVQANLNVDHISQCNHYKFDLKEWPGTKDQLIFLLDHCRMAKELQDLKHNGVGWILKWNDEGISYHAHIAEN